MIPTNQDFIICYYCNKPLHITKAKDIVRDPLQYGITRTFNCNNCKYVKYRLFYTYNCSRFSDPESDSMPLNIEVDHIFVLIKDKISIMIRLQDWRYVPLIVKDINLGDSYGLVHEFPISIKESLLLCTMDKIRSKISNLLAFL